jgi:hypothetical protein
MARYWSQGSTHYRAAQHKTQAKNKNNFVSHIPTDSAKNLPHQGFFFVFFKQVFFSLVDLFPFFQTNIYFTLNNYSD